MYQESDLHGLQMCTISMHIIKSGWVLQSTIKLACFAVVTTTSTNKLSVLVGATDMAPNVKGFLQVVLLSYVVTTSMGSSIDLQKAFAIFQKDVEDLKQQSQEEINSLVTELNELRHQSKQEIKLLHHRLEQIEAKG